MNDTANTQDRVPALMKEAQELSGVVDAWTKKISEISTEDEAQQIRDLLAKLTGRLAQVEADREREKRPYIDAGRAVDARYEPIKRLLNACIAPIQSFLTIWLRRERERQREEAAAARREADILAKKAEAARKAVQEHRTVEATLTALDAEKRAADALVAMNEAMRAKPQVASASGGVRKAALRTTYYAVLTSVPLACRRYGDHPDVVKLFESLASAEARAAKGKIEIPGFNVRSKETAV